MHTISTIYSLVHTDLRERTRRYSFFVVMILTLWLGYILATGQMYLSFGNYQGVNNTAWIGLTLAITISFLFSWGGFFVVKGSITRDYDTRVGQIIAATPIHKFTYLFGKALSNFVVLVSMVILLTVGGIAIALVQGEGQFDLLALLRPIILIGLPPLFFAACTAVLFEAIPFLRGALGNFIYLVTFGLLLQFNFGKSLLGVSFAAIIEDALRASDPTFIGGFALGSVSGGEVLHPFFVGRL